MKSAMATYPYLPASAGHLDLQPCFDTVVDFSGEMTNQRYPAISSHGLFNQAFNYA